MEQIPNGELAERIEEALRMARELEDENLQAALCRARDSPDDTRFLLPLLQLPQDDANNGRAAPLPDEQIVERKVMCPEMYRAALSGSAQRVQDFLAASDTTTDQQGRAHVGRCSLEEVTAGWNTILHVAAGQGQVVLVQQLFREGAGRAAAMLLPSVNSRSETALHHAARAGHHEVVSLLISLAQTHGPGAARVLVTKNSGGDTALHVAARHGREAVVKVLMVAAPALSGVANDAGMSPLYLAVVSRSLGAVKALIRWRHASASGPKRQNALHAAVLQSAEITQELLSWNPTLAKEIDESESTPLHYAVSDGDSEIISKFIRSVPSALYLQDKEGFTPLHIAAWMGHVRVIQDIIEACPDSAELVDKEGRNFLHVAIERCQEAVVTYIVGIPFLTGLVNEQDKKGNTPLHYAVVAGHPNLAILESGAIELNIANNEGKTAFDLATGRTNFLLMIDFVLKLSARGARFGTQRQDGITPWKGKMIKEWQEKTSKSLVIVAVLIATVALTAMFNVPGGYDSNGKANLRATRTYKSFLVFDTLAVASSMTSTMFLTYSRGAAYSGVAGIYLSVGLSSLWVAVISIILAFLTAVISGLDKTNTKLIIPGILGVPLGSFFVLNLLSAEPASTSVHLLLRILTGEDRGRLRKHIRRRFPLVWLYPVVLSSLWFFLTIVLSVFTSLVGVT